VELLDQVLITLLDFAESFCNAIAFLSKDSATYGPFLSERAI
jgi:hypothetical protein